MDKQVTLNKIEQLIKVLADIKNDNSVAMVSHASDLATQIRAQIRKA